MVLSGNIHPWFKADNIVVHEWHILPSLLSVYKEKNNFASPFTLLSYWSGKLSLFSAPSPNIAGSDFKPRERAAIGATGSPP
ncbi:hypothetical protein [Brenneria roseae]|uniref:hypothetical protein n=1 Tax=Brenneria roseae TaxID=1509241 RepID=UPI00109DA905|nr:hypothetical protein [Brenneria roseae]